MEDEARKRLVEEGRKRLQKFRAKKKGKPDVRFPDHSAIVANHPAEASHAEEVPLEGRSGPEEGGPETCKSKWVPLAESPHAHVISDVAPSPRAKRRSFDDEYAHVTSTCAANTAPAAPPIRNLRHLPEQEVCTQATLKVSNGVKWWSSDDDSVHAHSTSTAGIDMAATPHGNLIRFSEQAVLMDATLVKSNGIALIGEKSHGPMKYRRHAPMGVETWLKNRASRMRGAMAVALEMEHAVAAVACSRTDMGFAQELMRSTHDVVLRLESGGYKVQDMDEAQVRALAEEWAPAAESLSRLRQLRAMQPQKNGGNESGLDGISAVIPADGVLENRIGHAAFENGAGHAVLENGRIDAYNGSAEERSSRHDSHKGMGRDFGVVDSPIRGAPSASKGSGGDPWASPYEADVGAEHAQSPFTTSRSIIVARDTASVRPVWNLGAEHGDRLEEHGFMGQDQLSASQLRAAASEVSSNPYRGGSRMGGSAGEDSRDLVSELIWENSSLLRRVEVQANALIEMSVEKEKWIAEKAMVDSKQKQAEARLHNLAEEKQQLKESLQSVIEGLMSQHENAGGTSIDAALPAGQPHRQEEDCAQSTDAAQDCLKPSLVPERSEDWNSRGRNDQHGLQQDTGGIEGSQVHDAVRDEELMPTLYDSVHAHVQQVLVQSPRSHASVHAAENGVDTILGMSGREEGDRGAGAEHRDVFKLDSHAMASAADTPPAHNSRAQSRAETPPSPTHEGTTIPGGDVALHPDPGGEGHREDAPGAILEHAPEGLEGQGHLVIESAAAYHPLPEQGMGQQASAPLQSGGDLDQALGQAEITAEQPAECPAHAEVNFITKQPQVSPDSSTSLMSADRQASQAYAHDHLEIVSQKIDSQSVTTDMHMSPATQESPLKTVPPVTNTTARSRRTAPPSRPFPPELLAHPGDKELQITLRHVDGFAQKRHNSPAGVFSLLDTLWGVVSLRVVRTTIFGGAQKDDSEDPW